MGSRRFESSSRERRFPFQVVRHLGKGAMGTVVEIRLPDHPRPLAAKILTRQTGHARERFRREGELMSRLRHPCIVGVHSAGVLDDGCPYLIFELVQGEPLHELLEREGTLPERRALEIGADLADALHHAHEAGIVHRDVKPSNVLIDGRDGRPRLTDFGIALAADQDRLTKTGAWAGTPLYMAPEQLTHGEILPQTDLYALGAVVFQLLCGRPPIEAERSGELMHSIVHEIPPDVRSLRPDVSRAAASVVARCLEKEPERRYGSGRELAFDLRAVARGESLTSGSRVQGLARTVKRAWGQSRVRWAALCVFVALAAAPAAVVGVRRAQAAGLTDLAASLDKTRLALRQAGAGTSEAEALLETSASALANAAEGPERELLSAARVDLHRALGQRHALDLAAIESDPADPEAWAMRVEAFAAVPSPTGALKDRAERRFEEQRGGLVLWAARLDEARVALTAALAAEARRKTVSRDSTSHLLAYTLLLAGDLEGARELLKSADTELVVELELAAAQRHGAGPELAAALAELRGMSGPEPELLRAWAEVMALPAEADGLTLWALLERARAVSDPAQPSDVEPGLRARASLLEGELLVRLGWFASAAHAYARVQSLLPAEALTPWVGVRARAPDGSSWPALLPARQAAGVGEAWARAQLLDPAAALRSAEAGRVWGRLSGDHRVALAAELVLAEALSIAFRADDAEAALGRARALGVETAVVETVAGQLARRRGEAVEAPPRPGAALVYAEAEAELEAWWASRRTLARENPFRDRARRGFLLALAGEPATAARAWAGLARLHVLEEEPRAAAEAGELGATLAPDDWYVLLGRGLGRAAARQAGARADVQLAADRLQGAGLRLLETVAEAQWLYRAAANTFGRAGDMDACGAMWEAAADHALRSKLSLSYQVAVLQAGLQAAQKAQDEARFERLKALRTAALKRLPQHNAWWAKVIEQWEKPDLAVVEEEAALKELLAASPLHGPAYTMRWTLSRRAVPEGFHSLALGWELVSGFSCDYMEDFRKGYGHEALAGVVPRAVLAEPARDPELPEVLAADPDIQVAVTVLMGKVAWYELPREAWWRGYQAAQRLFLRRPRLQSAQLALAGFRLELGDPSGALPLIEASAKNEPLFENQRRFALEVDALWRAQVWGALREWERVGEVLATIPRPNYLVPELERDPRLWEDRDVPASLHPVVQAQFEAWKAAQEREE
jgi:serine/threonine-protein kinase